MSVLYQTDDPSQKAMEMMGKASSSYRSMAKGGTTKTTTEGPGKTAGGALMTGMSGAGSGASLAMMMGTNVATGGMWGAGVGLASYLLS